jgi:cytochrome d ubiquinol oxidase subunit II
MLGALILRGVAFEFRHKAGPRLRMVWDIGFVGGSLIAAFVQGSTVGTLVTGLPVTPDGRFDGHSVLDWLSPFAALCGLGLCVGDALLGAAWLVLKSEGELRDRCYRLLPWLLAGVLAFLACALFASLRMELAVMHRWIERPWLVVFPCLGLLAVVAMLVGIRRRHLQRRSPHSPRRSFPTWCHSRSRSQMAQRHRAASPSSFGVPACSCCR